MPLTQEQIEYFRQKLLARKAEIQQELEGIAVKDPNMKGNWTAVLPQYGIQQADMSEYADEVEEYETRITQEGVLEERLADIELSLEKIEKGNYGICEKGNDDIELQRLEAIPEARVCIKHLPRKNP